ncbi:MAG: 3-oxocholest-4-en-26-oate--CoA ligase [Acidimicrobiales bacterium]|nr:MAG: acyl-CoA synthetase [Actinomycetota bacterium]MBV6508708.1 3-oxocholest-4-en-26-oate--CoA ligase [Acidimicrobiales bacterium]RIK08219.1 MAG: acyl-CoA synthetase [Acidobacteriota bacterium]
MEFQLADLFERLCDARPEADAVVAGTQARRSRIELDRRANRLAHHLESAGIRAGDHVGVYSQNRIEWVEALLACWKIRCVAVNINYRYVLDELRYLWENADMAALLFEQRYGPAVAELAGEFPSLQHYVRLTGRPAGEEGDAGEDLGVDYEEALAGASDARDFGPRCADDLYLVYTGGTTGLPKGVLWRHEDLFLNIVGALVGELGAPEEIDRLADNPFGMRTLTLSPLMHGGGQWPLFITLFSGGVGLLPTSPSFDPDEVLRLIESERVVTLSIIGDAMGRPLAEAKLGAGSSLDTSSLVAISSGGALLTAPVREMLREAFGEILVTGGVGSSEIGSAARETGSADPVAGPHFKLDATVAVLGTDLSVVGPGGVGRLARTGRIPVGYYKDPEKTAATFVTDGSGRRWVIPGDWARVEPDGSITLLGRGSACINSGGEKIFPDEVEQAIAEHPKVRHAVVVGVPDPVWMERVVALVEPVEQATLTLPELQQHCRRLLAGYKVPRALVLTPIRRTPTGKVDHVWARATAEAGAAD